MDFVEFENSVERLTSYDFEYLKKKFGVLKRAGT